MRQNITYDSIVESSSLWPEPVHVHAYQPRSNGDIHIVGTLINSKQPINQELTPAEAETLQIVQSQLNFIGNARRAFLHLEAKRYQYAALYNPTFAISISKVDPLPHQIEAVWQVLKQPRIRFLIADDPGAGKTIMAGLIAKELKLRNQAKRILIVAPGHLITQWTEEMKTRFEENFTHVTRAFVNAHASENVWQREQQLITSIDFARQDDIRGAIAHTHFDLIIVDEAHKMAAYQYGDKVEKTKRYQLGECLSRCTTHLLFLTATPHRGDSENFRLFLDLLEPGFFAEPAQIEESIQKKDNPLLIRRVKEDLKDFEGKALFLPRHVQTKTFHLGSESESEMELYNELSEYIREQYNRFSENSQKRNNVAFALVILQRRLASSTRALHVSLQRRQKRLQVLLDNTTPEADTIPTEAQRDDIEDLSEVERWELEEQWEVLSVAENREELANEIQTLKHLEQKAESIIQNKGEIKLQALKEALDELNVQHPNQKILIFTEYFDTLNYLQQKVKEWGFSVSVIDGKMPHEKRVEAQQTFQNETQILIATEAAGEGINLQFCHLMINYDLPWNPNRLEQRMGRIHRYGQKKEAHVINLVASDTREGAVFTRLFEKLDTIRNELGKDSVYDVIGELFPKQNLAQLLLEAAASTRDHNQLLKEFEAPFNSSQLKRFQKFNEDTLVSHYINLPQVSKLQQEAREQGLIPEYTREFFRKTLNLHDIELHQRRDKSFSIPRIPSQITRTIQDDEFRQMHPGSTLRKNYAKVTFDKAHAAQDSSVEFISFGHPLFEATLRYVEQEYAQDLKAGACFEDPDAKLNGIIVFYEGEIQDGTDTVVGRQLFAFYLPENSEAVEPINPVVLWDLQEADADATAEPIEIKTLEAKIGETSRLHLDQYKQELTKERERQVDIKKKYGIASLEKLIIKLDGELLELGVRSERGEDVRLVTQNKRHQKEHYEREKAKLETACQQEVRLSRKPPTFAGAVRVRPAAEGVETPAHNRLEIEQLGMAYATRHEEAQGRTVDDVSSENLGFDLRSKTPDGKIRCIEVKARSERAPVVLTSNEWFKAKQIKDDYFLYVVLNASTHPELHIIKDPANEVRAQQVTEVRYQVPLSEIVKNGEAV